MKLRRIAFLGLVLLFAFSILYGDRLIVTFRSNASTVIQRRAHQRAHAQMVNRKTTPWVVEVEAASPSASIARYGQNPIVVAVHTVTNTPTVTPTNTPTNTPTETPTSTPTNAPTSTPTP